MIEIIYIKFLFVAIFIYMFYCVVFKLPKQIKELEDEIIVRNIKIKDRLNTIEQSLNEKEEK